MIDLIVPEDVENTLHKALKNAGDLECGGVLMGEHVGPNQFLVARATVQVDFGSCTSFIRNPDEASDQLNIFFDETGRDYKRFNYLGEWHSHPNFAPLPSKTDDKAMLGIVNDPDVGATFAVLLVCQADDCGRLVGSANTYLPNGDRCESTLRFVLGGGGGMR